MLRWRARLKQEDDPLRCRWKMRQAGQSARRRMTQVSCRKQALGPQQVCEGDAANSARHLAKQLAACYLQPKLEFSATGTHRVSSSLCARALLLGDRF